MQSRPSFDIEILLVIAAGAIIFLGLGWIFLANFGSEPPAPLTPPTLTLEPTPSPSEVTPFLTRTPRTPRPSPSATSTQAEPSPTATATSFVAYPGPGDGTLSPGSGPAPSVPTIPEGVESLLAGKYDDTHPDIGYDRFWTFRMNPGTAHAYKGTLHTSDSIGNELSFYFTGQRIILGYQRGRNFGTVTVIIDGQSYSFHEQAFGNIWRSPRLSPGTHSVRLIHQSGQSINLDSIEVVG